MTTFRHGALWVVSETDPKDQLLRSLKEIDRRLFFEKQVDLRGEAVWCVVCDLGSDQPPVTLLEWRDENGRPIPELASGVLTRMASMERDGSKLAKSVVEANKRFRAGIEAEMRYQIEEQVHDYLPIISEKKRPVLFRSQSLRQSRDKQRSKGVNI